MGWGQRLERCRMTVSDVAVSGGHNISKSWSIESVWRTDFHDRL